MDPEDFLEQAERDYELGGVSARVNAITNAKRAIRCQIDKLLTSFGFDVSRMKIQQKVKLVQRMGFVAPRIIQRVDQARNLLEHQYKAPSMRKVEEALDLATLFVEACGRNLHLFEGEFNIGNEDDHISTTVCTFRNELSIDFLDDKKVFDVGARKGQTNESDTRPGIQVGDTTIAPGDAIFPDLVRIALLASKDRQERLKNAIQELFKTLGLKN